MVETPCWHPTRAELTQFALGLANADDSLAIERHLGDCADCCRSLEAAPDDRLIALLRSSAVSQANVEIPTSLRPGYEILDEVGRGGMGVVYRARQIGLGRIVAFKRLNTVAPSGEALARFRREGSAIARLAHPNIVTIYDIGEQQGVPYLAMELIDGPTLESRLNGNPILASDAAQLVATLARAIDFAHSAGIVHRDLKPANVLLQPDSRCPDGWGTPKIVDFGLARTLGAGSGTQTGSLLGTPAYMAPEQADGSPVDLGPAADIYSLGAILYEALAGRPPFRAATALETLALARANEPVSLRTLQPGTPRDLETIAFKCLEKTPGRRYATAGALADDLQRFLERRPIVARPANAVERAVKWSRRRPAAALLLAFGVTVLLAAAAGGWLHSTRLRVEVNRATTAEDLALRRVEEGYDALSELISTLYEDSPDTAAIQMARARVADQSLSYFHNTLAEADESHPKVRLTRAILLIYAANIERMLEQPAKALSDLASAQERLEMLESDPQFAARAGLHLAACYRSVGLVHQSQNNSTQAERCFELGVAKCDALLEIEPSSFKILERRAECNELLGDLFDRERKFDRAARHFELALADRRRVASKLPESTRNLVKLAEVAARRVLVQPGVPKLDESLAEIEEIESILISIPESARSRPLNLSLAKLLLAHGLFEFDSGRFDASLELFNRGLESLGPSLQEEPGDMAVRTSVHILHRARAWVLCRSGRMPESVADWRSAADFADGVERTFCRTELALERSLAGDHQTALDETVALLAEAPLPVRTLIHLARVCSQSIEAAQNDPALSTADTLRATLDRCDQLAEESLKQLGAHFRLDAAQLVEIDTDPALSALRQTETFRRWRDGVPAN